MLSRSVDSTVCTGRHSELPDEAARLEHIPTDRLAQAMLLAVDSEPEKLLYLLRIPTILPCTYYVYLNLLCIPTMYSTCYTSYVYSAPVLSYEHLEEKHMNKTLFTKERISTLTFSHP